MKFVPTNDPFVIKLKQINIKKDDIKDAIQIIKKVIASLTNDVTNTTADDTINEITNTTANDTINIENVLDELKKKDLGVEMFVFLYEMCLRGENVKEHVRNEIVRHKKDNEKKISCFKEFIDLI